MFGRSSLQGLILLVVVAFQFAFWPYLFFFLFTQGNAVRRRLFSGFLLEHIAALIRLGLPLKRGISSCGSEVSSLSRRDLEEIENQLGSGSLLVDALAHVPYSLSSIGTLFFSFICLLNQFTT